jgi:WXG100 family type VII secretion target
MTIQIEHAAFDRATRLVEEIVHDVRHEHRQAQAEVSELLSSGWKGAASDQFGRAWQQWCRGMDDVLSAMGLQNALLAQVRSDLDGTDETRADAARRLRSRLGETP